MASSTDGETLHPRFRGDFVQIAKCGRGVFGRVYKCQNILDEQFYAIKKIPCKLKEIADVMREVKILSKLNHCNIMRYHHAWIETGVAQEDEDEEDKMKLKAPVVDYSDSDSSEVNSDDGRATKKNKVEMTPKVVDSGPDSIESWEIPFDHTLFICTELCESSLEEFLSTNYKDGKMLTTAEIWNYFFQIIEGIHVIHSLDVAHNDLNTKNILVGYDEKIKIADFGIASMPPQDGVIQQQYNDIFEAGLVLIHLLFSSSTERDNVVKSVSAYGAFKEKTPLSIIFEEPHSRPRSDALLSISENDGIVYCKELEAEILKFCGWGS